MGITAYLPVYWLIALVVFLVIEADGTSSRWCTLRGKSMVAIVG